FTSTLFTPFKFSKDFSTDDWQCAHVIPLTSRVTFCIYVHLPPKKNVAYILTLFKRRELVTTLTELNAIAAPATHGANKPTAAIGIPALLYAKAQNRFWRMFLIVS